MNEESDKIDKPKRQHLIKNLFLRRGLKIAGGILLFILLLPVLIYIPPIQTLLKDVACSMVQKSTGMEISIERFRLKFPIDISLQGVKVIEAQGDTMATVGEALVDVKLLPLLHLDAQVNKLNLRDAYYRMVASDSSMIMTLRVDELVTQGATSANIAKSEINLDKAVMNGGSVNLYMNVWKQIPKPSEPGTFLIKANDLQLNNFSFAMSMLPTIDTLTLDAADISLKKGVVDLRNNVITASSLAVNGSDITYMAPTAQYVATHPAPAPSPYESIPMEIRADTVKINNSKALYTTVGVSPTKGFDASYIQVSDLNISVENFFNRSSSIRLPITSLKASERCGVQISSGYGTVEMDSTGLSLDNLSINTIYSEIKADMFMSTAFMSMNPDANMSADVVANIGVPDMVAFMPDLRNYTKLIPKMGNLDLKLNASGSLNNLSIPKLKLSVPSLLSLDASGSVSNVMTPSKMNGKLTFDGKLINPAPFDNMLSLGDIKLPPFTIKGDASVVNNNYAAQFKLQSVSGNIAAKGRVGLNTERYYADIDVNDLNISKFMPDLGIGTLTAHLSAEGAGFNPTKTGASTDIVADISHIDYNGNSLSDIYAVASLHDGDMSLEVDSDNPIFLGHIEGTGRIASDDYTVDLTAALKYIDLQALGLSDSTFNGSGVFTLSGTASPNKWLYDIDFAADNICINMPDNSFNFPNGITASLLSSVDSVDCRIDADRLQFLFASPCGLHEVIERFTKASNTINEQLAAKSFEIDVLQPQLPQFTFKLNAAGDGIVGNILSSQGMMVDSIYADFTNEDLFKGNCNVIGFNTGSMLLDTLSLSLSERGKMLDYALNLRNAKGNLDEFAKVSVTGYVGGNRGSLYLNQQNVKGETGYRLGLTGALVDSTLSLHFTPLNATIAYMPWKFNEDNYIEYGLDRHIDADLLAESAESKIYIRTKDEDDYSNKVLYADLENIHLQDFLNLLPDAPPVEGSLNSSMKLVYEGKALIGKGNMSLQDLVYDHAKIGNLDFDFDAGVGFDGNTAATAALNVNGQKALVLTGSMRDSVGGASSMDMDVKLTKFPLNIVNPFIGADVASVGGSLSGDMCMTGSFTSPLLNGTIKCDSVSVFIPMIGSSLTLDEDPITVSDNVITLDKFGIWGANENPLNITGVVNARNLINPQLDITMNSRNFMAFNNDKRAHSDIYGKMLLNMDGSVKGPLSFLDISGSVSILNGSDVSYVMSQSQQESLTQQSDDVVKFVNFSDTTQVAEKDSLENTSRMKIAATLNISNGVKASIFLSSSASDKVEIYPVGTLIYNQNYMGDMTLNGKLSINSGSASYSVPLLGEKKFTIKQGSYVNWNGTLLNPVINLNAYEELKSAVQNGKSQRLVNFLISVAVTNTLTSPKLTFDLSAQDDLSIQNELQSMSADQRSNQAMNMLLYGKYVGPGSTSLSSDNLIGNQLYSFLTSQINSWAANNIRGVDLSFGVNQYDTQENGKSGTATSYSYQLSKSLFNNKFKIVVGGNYSTDSSTDENFAENLVSDVSFEYMLRQTNTMSLYVKLFRHSNYESILEGEVTEMGLGFVVQRRLTSLRQLFSFLKPKKRKKSTTTTVSDSIPQSEVDTVNYEVK
jgi:hypothetical protein